MKAFISSSWSLRSLLLISGAVEAVSIVIILIGCWGEGRAERENMPHKWKAFFWKMVVFGLMAECVAFIVSFLGSNMEIERLRRENIELNARLNPRVITTEQRNKFLNILPPHKRTHVRVLVGPKNWEADNYAAQIRNLLNEAGYGSADEQPERMKGHVEAGSLPYPFPEKGNLFTTPIYFVLYCTNSDSLTLFQYPLSAKTTNYWPGMFIVSERKGEALVQTTYVKTNEAGNIEIGAMPVIVASELGNIGVEKQYVGTTNILKPGEWAIFVSPKQY